MAAKSSVLILILSIVFLAIVCSSGCTNTSQRIQNPPTTTITPVPSNSPITTTSPTLQPAYVSDLFYPSGWMGDTGDIKYDPASGNSPHSGTDAIRIDYSVKGSAKNGWAGIYWLYPDNNWGTNPDGRNLKGYSRVIFWARGANGDEKAEFRVGGVTGKYPDSVTSPVSSGVIVLTKDWKQYTIDLTGKDISHVIGGFCWVTNNDQNPNGSTIYLDDMVYT
jgi:hypothetical protein